jgi:hypothetical protein
MSRLEILTDLNISTCWCNDCLRSRVDSYADLLRDGLLTVESDGDMVVSLSPTATGRAKLAPMLPTAIS